MNRSIFALFCVTLILCNVSPILTKRTFGGGRHSYPKSGGLSGGGSHSYPSGGLSGGSHGNSHGYPQSGGLSGSGHGYPSSGGSHSYPSSGGSHSYPSSGGAHSYPSSGGMNHGYPSNNNHQYPNGKGLSGNSPSNMGAGHTTNIHHHYNYNPPQQIRYTPVHGGPPMNYPVYHHTPPSYVYQYKDSGSKYGTLLAGLALLNLGTLGVSAYALSKSHSNYKPQPGEICKFGLKKENGDYEETRIDCQLITSFIFQEEAKTHTGGTNTTVVTTVTNVTMVNTTNGLESALSDPVRANPHYEMLPNGTLVPLNSTANNITANHTASQADGSTTSSVTVTTTNTTTVTNALDVKGKPIEVTSGMKCYVMRHTPSSNMRKSVPCDLLQSYAQQSLKRNSATRNVPVMVVFTAVLAVLMAFIISACWVAGAVVGLLPLFGWHSVEDSEPGCYFVEVMDYNYLLFLYFATIVTPSILLAAFYAHIYRVVVKQMSAVMTVEGGQGQRGTMLRVLGAAQKREVKATQNLAIIVFFFIVCWIPLYTMNAIKAFKPELDIPNPLTYFCIIFSHLNSAINPLLYAYHLKDFRSALKGLILTIFGRGVPLPAAYRPPVPIRRPALERCNALRERPRVYVNSPVWLRQREAEMAANEEKNKASKTLGNPDLEPFLNKSTKEGSSGRYSPDGKEGNNGPYLIESSQACQSPYKKVEEFIRRVRSVSSDNS